jgi:Holliday junction DNA helicase RuvB
MTCDNTRPSGFSSFIGQDKPKRVLQILVQSAKRKGTCVPHVLLSGPPGLGKTTLSRIIAQEMGSRLVEIIASNLQAPEQMVKHLTRLKENDVLFIDEIHGLPRGVEEILYGALEDGRISVTQAGYDDMLKGLGLGKKQPTSTMVKLPQFTCVGATTLSGLVSDPLRSRFVQCLSLEAYSDEELRHIILDASAKMDFAITPEIAMEVARRSRSTARTAIANLRWLYEYCGGTGSEPDATAIKDAFDLKEISPEGLTKVDMAYLTALVESGEPLGLSTLAACTGESEETLAQAIEPFLIRKGFIRKGPRGRISTAKAMELADGKSTQTAEGRAP